MKELERKKSESNLQFFEIQTTAQTRTAWCRTAKAPHLLPYCCSCFLKINKKRIPTSLLHIITYNSCFTHTFPSFENIQLLQNSRMSVSIKDDIRYKEVTVTASFFLTNTHMFAQKTCTCTNSLIYSTRMQPLAVQQITLWCSLRWGSSLIALQLTWWWQTAL